MYPTQVSGLASCGGCCCWRAQPGPGESGGTCGLGASAGLPVGRAVAWG